MSQYDDTVLADNPVAYWKCNETTPPPPAPNTSFIDSSGFGNHGTLQPNSVAGLTQGHVGPILTDSAPENLAMGGGLARIPSLGPNSGTLFQTGNQTWECWFQRPSPDTDPSGTYILMNRGGDATNTFLSVNERSVGALPGHVVGRLDWSFVVGEVFSCVVTPNEWHLAHLVYDADNGVMYEYIDTWLTDTQPGCPPPPLTDTSPWRIGYATNLVFGAVFRSYRLARVAVYPSILTPFKIAQRSFAAIGSRMDNPCGDTITGGCPS